MSATIEFARWIAVDWGNTHQRAWAIDADGGVRAHVARTRDPRDIPPDAWEAALLDLIGDWLGMGAHHGLGLRHDRWAWWPVRGGLSPGSGKARRYAAK